MRVLIAFDKFRDSLRALQACEIAAEALHSIHRDWVIDLCPLTDGGEGFCETLTSAVSGHLEQVGVHDPLGIRIRAPMGLTTWRQVPEDARAMLVSSQSATAPSSVIAIIDMASASGLGMLPLSQRNPWFTSSSGTGDLIRAAKDKGAQKILLGIGGSSTNDLGLGALSALGIRPRFRSPHPQDTLPVPAQWSNIEGFEGKAPADLPELFIACDVTNPLLGAEGATKCFGPQKGLPLEDVPKLDALMANIAALLQKHCGCPSSLVNEPGSGAAGGIACGLMCAAKARLVLGSALVSSWLALSRRIESADIIITGEGCFDQGSLGGKGPGAVISHALGQGKSVHLFAGRLEQVELPGAIHAHEISPRTVPLAESLARAPEYLRESLIGAFRDDTGPDPAPSAS